MKLPLRLLGLSAAFVALIPAASARSIDDFAFPRSSSSSSTASSISSEASSQSSSEAHVDSVVPSTKYTSPAYRVKVIPKAEPTAQEKAAMEAALPESRAGFVSMIVHRLYNDVTIDTCYWSLASELPPEFTLVFTDVPTAHTYGKEICVAFQNGIIRGYGDGSFRPDAPVTFAEASKMISRAYALHPWPDVAAATSNPWFDVYVRTLDAQAAIPESVRSFDQRMTRAVVGEILDRLDGHITNRTTTPLSVLQADWTRRFSPPRRATTVRTTTQKSSAGASQGTSAKPSTASQTSSAAAQQSSSARSYPAWIY
jgi:hypothetical protein